MTDAEVGLAVASFWMLALLGVLCWFARKDLRGMWRMLRGWY